MRTPKTLIISAVFGAVLILAMLTGVLCVDANSYKKDFFDIVKENCEVYQLEQSLCFAIIKTESGFNASAVSRAGAKGLMQITDETALWVSQAMGLKKYDLFSPADNIAMGSWFLRFLITETQDVRWALAAYNAGPKRAKEWREKGLCIDELPYKETRDYVRKVTAAQKYYRRIL